MEKIIELKKSILENYTDKGNIIENRIEESTEILYKLSEDWHNITNNFFKCFQNEIEAQGSDANILELIYKVEQNINTNPKDDIAFNEIIKSFDKLVDIIANRSKLAHPYIQYLPCIFHLGARLLQLNIKNNDILNSLYVIFEKLKLEFFNATRCIATKRYNSIYIVNEDKVSKVHLYDGFLQQALTISFQLTQETSKPLIAALRVLRHKITIDYLNALPISYIFKAFDLLTDNSSSQGVSVQIYGYVYSNTDIDKDIAYASSIILPNIAKQYFNNIDLAKFGNFTPAISDADNQKLIPNSVIKGALNALITKIIDTTFTKGIAKTIALVTAPCIAPIISFLVDLVFPGTPPITREEMTKEINRLISKALDKYHLDEIIDLFGSSVDAYTLFMEDLANLNKGNNNKDTWDLGSPFNWEAPINTLNILQSYLFDTKYSFQYQTHQIFPTFITMYSMLVNGKIMARKQGDSIKAELGLLTQLYNGWYIYLNKLAEQIWNKTLDYLDFRRLGADFNLPAAETTIYKYRLVDNYNYDSYPYISFEPLRVGVGTMDVTNPERLKPTMGLLETRFKLYAVINTGLKSMCNLYDQSAIQINKLYNLNLPTDAEKNIYDPIIDNYQKLANHYAGSVGHDNSFPLGGAKFNFGLPALYNQFSNKQVYSLNDAHIEISDKNGVTKQFAAGDYPILDDNFSKKPWAYITIPRPFRVFLYTKPNFKGEITTIMPEGTTEFNFKNINPLAQSMKVRLDFGHWFDNPYTKNYSRILDLCSNNIIKDIPLIDLPNNPS